MPSPALVEADDYVLIHGNGLRPAGVEAAIKAIRAMPAWQAHDWRSDRYRELTHSVGVCHTPMAEAASRATGVARDLIR